MALVRQAAFLLSVVAFGLGFFPALVEAASCPAAKINASEICEDVGSNSVKTAANLSYVICDNLQNLSQVNRSFVVRALEHTLRQRNEVPQSVVKVLVNQVDGEELEAGLEEFNRKIINSSLISPAWKATVLRSLWDEKLRNEDLFNETSFVASWFQERLRPFIAAISVDMLQCLQNETLRCEQYQAIVKGLNKEFAKMTPQTQADVFHSFQLPYLKGLNSNGSACRNGLNSSSWLTVNFRSFSRYAKYQDFLGLNSDLVHMEVLQSLTSKQLGELSATVGGLRTLQDVEKVMGYIGTSILTEYIDEFNSQANISLSKEIQAGLLEHVLTAAQPIFQKAGDGEFILWMERRLPVLIPGMNSTLVPLLFDHLESRNCSALKAVVALLNSSVGEFSNVTRRTIYEEALHLLSNTSLRCYASNSSFSAFLEETFQGFVDFLTLSDLRTVIPSSDLPTVANTVPPDDLADLFSRNGFLNDDPFLTALLRNYKKTGLFMDRFNQRDLVAFLPNATKVALLSGVWATVVSQDTNETEVDKWLKDRLDPYIPFLDGEILNGTETLNASCGTFHRIVSKLNEDVGTFSGREEEIYFSIKAYLAATDAKPRCYDRNDPETSDWLVMYFRAYIHYSSARDMRTLTNHSAAIFQDLAFNRDNLELIHRYKVRKDLAEMYAAALFAVDPDFSLNSLPDQLLCFARHSTLIASLSPAEALSLIARVNRHCNASRPSASDRQKLRLMRDSYKGWKSNRESSAYSSNGWKTESIPSRRPSGEMNSQPPSLQPEMLATMLVGQIKTFDNQTLVALGQQAVGLTAGQIANLTASVLMDTKVLESLGQVTGWNRGQAQMLVSNILRNNFTLDSLGGFERLGTLVQGLPSITFDRISADLALELLKNGHFVRALGQGPEHLKKAFIVKVLANASSPWDILSSIPDALLGQVPSSLLVLRGTVPDLVQLNQKPWSPQQAAVLFGDVLSNTKNYSKLSAFILQGLQCNAASRLMPGQLSDLVQEVKVKRANLSEEQLSCMARLLIRNNQTTNFTAYPPDVLLFFPLNKVGNQSCEAFYSLASQGNLSLLTNGSSQRTRLVENALGCFGVRNTSLSRKQLEHLGAFVCDLDASTIKNSDPGILENLKLCPDLTMSQRTAFNALLSTGKTAYKMPESWDDGTLESLGTLVYYINRTTWDSIHKEEKRVFLRNKADAYDSLSAVQKEKVLHLFKAVGRETAPSSRAKRATETCKTTPITAGTLEDSLFLIHYDSAQEFEACLSDEVLKDNLALLLEQPLPNDYLSVVKKKLDKVYPDGIPEDQLKGLGSLSRQYSADEMAKWKVTSRDTLAALLDPDNGPWETAQIKQLITRYTESGGTLAGPFLNMLGGKYLCYLDEDQLKQIDPEAIRHAETLDLSTCSQGKKDVLYGKARLAFASQEGTGAYYPLIRPYLGGAPVEDLKKLVGSQVVMDFKTFHSLNPEELQKLSVQDMKGLLGVNLPVLKELENDPAIAGWIRRQYQSELDTLGIGLTGGMAAQPPTDARSTAMNVSSDARSDAPAAPTSVVPATGFTLSAANHATSPGRNASAPSGITSAGENRVSSIASVGSHMSPFSSGTPAADETSPSKGPSIAAVPKVDFPTETATVSSDVTDIPDDTFTASPASSAGGGLDMTMAHSSTRGGLNTTVDSAMAFPSEATSSDSTADTTPPSTTRVDLDTTSDTAHLTPLVDSTSTTNPSWLIGGAPDPAFTETDTYTTPASTTRVDSDKTLPDTTEDNFTDVPTNITTAPNETHIGILTPGSTRGANLTSSAITTSLTSYTARHTSPPPVDTDSNLTVVPNATFSPTPVIIHIPGTTRASTTRSKGLTSTGSGVARTLTGEPPAPPRPSPSATASASTKKPSKKPPARTKAPLPPTPNGYINVQPLNALASKASLSWLLLLWPLIAGALVQRTLL